MALYKIEKDSSGTPQGYELISGGTLYADSPIGTILPYGGATAPSGWFLCQGQAISRTTYSELFAVIGTSFGAGDGSTTFNLPDMTGKTAMGVETGHDLGASENGALPNITGGLNILCGVATLTGPFEYTGAETKRVGTNESSNGHRGQLDFDASLSSTIYKDDQSKVDPANVRVNYIIKSKMIGVPADFLAKVDETINENATSPVSASNKLVTESDISTKVGAITGSGISYRTFTCTLSDATTGYQNHEFLLVTREENVLINARIHTDGTLNVVACNINGEANTITNIGYAFDNTTRTLTIGVTLASWAMTLSVVKLTYPKDVASKPTVVSTLPTLTNVTIKRLVTESELSAYYHKCIYARTNTSNSDLVKTLELEDGKCYIIEGYQGDNYKRTRVYLFSGTIRTFDEFTTTAHPFNLSFSGNVLTITFAAWSYNQCRIYEESPANGVFIG